MVKPLFQLALATCVQNAGLIDDVGATPYHLVRPILRRLNAKQLSAVESNSPLVTPESDELWTALIEKDFPDRPLPSSAKRSLIANSGEKMPTRALYGQYVDERETLRASSAERLRNFNQRLQKEKSRNLIVPLKGIVHEPVRRRVTSSYQPYNRTVVRPRTILGKAMRELEHRPLMFKGGTRNDPYRAFEQQKFEREKAERAKLQRGDLRPHLTNSRLRKPAAQTGVAAATSSSKNDRRSPTKRAISSTPAHTSSVCNSSIIHATRLSTAIRNNTQAPGSIAAQASSMAPTLGPNASRTAPSHSTHVPYHRNQANSALYQIKRPVDPTLCAPRHLGRSTSHTLPTSTSPSKHVPASARPIADGSSASTTVTRDTSCPDSGGGGTVVASPVSSEGVEPRKRKAPSIFLPKRKMPRAPRISVPKLDDPKPKQRQSDAKRTAAKPALRSSIFH